MPEEMHRLNIRNEMILELDSEIADVWLEDKWSFQFYCSERGTDFFDFLVEHMNDDGVKEFFIGDLHAYRNEAFAELIGSFDWDRLIDERIEKNKVNDSYDIGEE